MPVRSDDVSVQRGPTQLRFDLFGGLRVRRDEEIVDLGPPKQRTVLALLLLDLDRVVSVDRLVELMWDDDRDGAIASLQAYVSRLRRSLEPDRLPRNPATILLTQPPGYRVSVEPKQVDLHRFEAAVRGGLASVGQGDLADAKSTLDEALAIWSGPLLPELGDLPVVVDAARRADGLRLSAIEAAGQVRLDLGDHTAAATLLESEAITHPGRERLAAILALAQYRGQRQADALATIRRCRRELRESSGLAVGAEWNGSKPTSSTRRFGSITHRRRATALTARRPLRPPITRTIRSSSDRDRELEATAKLLDSMAATHGTAVVVSGEPGIGKTSLAGAIIGAASARGWRTAWARCAEHRSNPPLWVATQVAEQLGHDTFDVTVAPPATDGEPAGEGRFQVFRSFIDGLAETDHPLAIAIDDLQWADPDSLRLIEHLAVEVASLQVLLVVTTRPLADDAPSALVDTLAELSRVAGSLQLRLDGLTATDVDEWMARRSDDVAPGVAGLIHERTGGNPLFVKELTELLATDGRLGDETMARAARAIPPAIQFVVRRRVSHLDRSAQRLLSLAAVIGRRFDTDVLADVAQVDPTTVLDDLTPAFEAGLLVGSGTEISFSHTLVAEALADEVNAPRRAGIHAAAARCMAVALVPDSASTPRRSPTTRSKVPSPARASWRSKPAHEPPTRPPHKKLTRMPQITGPTFRVPWRHAVPQMYRLASAHSSNKRDHCIVSTWSAQQRNPSWPQSVSPTRPARRPHGGGRRTSQPCKRLDHRAVRDRQRAGCCRHRTNAVLVGRRRPTTRRASRCVAHRAGVRRSRPPQLRLRARDRCRPPRGRSTGPRSGPQQRDAAQTA